MIRQRGLAESCRTLDDDEARAVLLRSRPRLVQLAQLELPPDERASLAALHHVVRPEPPIDRVAPASLRNVSGAIHMCHPEEAR
jgi:hypothetical protein